MTVYRRPRPVPRSQMATTTIKMPRVLPTSIRPTSRLEHLPCEIVFLIAEQLIEESRIALTLTNRTMMTVLAPRTFNVAPRDFPNGLRVLHARRRLLEMLERDSRVLAVCEVCEMLHVCLPLPPPRQDCNKIDRMWCEDPEMGLELSGTNVLVTQPFVRKVILLRRAGQDISSFLAHLALTTPTRPRRGLYRFVMEDRARVLNDSFLLRRQLFITRATPFHGGTPSVHDLLSLWSILSLTHMEDWQPQLELDRPLLDSVIPPTACRSRRKHSGPSAHLAECYPNGVRVPRGALGPSWNCLLTHPVSCCCPVESVFKGHIGGYGGCSTDHCVNVLPAPQSGWGRILVLTAWRDLGDGIMRHDGSANDAKWEDKARKGREHDPNDTWRQYTSGRVGDVYEKYEGVPEGTTAFTPELPQHVAERLFLRCV